MPAPASPPETPDKPASITEAPKQTHEEQVDAMAAEAQQKVMQMVLGRKKPAAKPPEKADPAAGTESVKLPSDGKEFEEGEGQEKEPEEKPEEKPSKPAKSKKPARQEQEDDDEEQDPPKRSQRQERDAARKTERESATTAAEAAARAVKKVLREDREPKEPKETPKTKATAAELPKEFQAHLEALQSLPELMPEKYAGRDLVKEVIESDRAVRSYQAKWRRDNPGETYNPQDPEHDDFFNGLTLKISQEDLREADRSIAKRQAMEAAKEVIEKEYGEELTEVRKARKLKSMQPVIDEATKMVPDRMFGAIGGKAQAAYKKGPESLSAFLEADPDMKDAVVQAGNWAAAMIRIGVSAGAGITKLSNSNSDHVAFAEALGHIERELAEMEDPPYHPDGRAFATLAEVSDMPPARRARFYTIEDTSALPIFVAHGASVMAKRTYDRLLEDFEMRAKRRGWGKSQSPTEKEDEGEDREDEGEEKPEPKGRSHDPGPSVRAREQLPTGSQKNGDTSKSKLPESFLSAFRGSAKSRQA